MIYHKKNVGFWQFGDILFLDVCVPHLFASIVDVHIYVIIVIIKYDFFRFGDFNFLITHFVLINNCFKLSDWKRKEKKLNWKLKGSRLLPLSLILLITWTFTWKLDCARETLNCSFVFWEDFATMPVILVFAPSALDEHHSSSAYRPLLQHFEDSDTLSTC